MEKARVLKYVGTTAAAFGLVAAGAVGGAITSKYVGHDGATYNAMASAKFEGVEKFQASIVDHRGGKGPRGKHRGSGSGLNGLIQDGTLTQEQAETFHENLKDEMQAQRLAAIDKVLADLVANSTLTQEQADQIKSFFESRESGVATSNTSA